MSPYKGAERYKRQSRTMFYNMSTRKGAVDGLLWVEYRVTALAQRGLSTRTLESLRRSWAAQSRDPQRLTWPDFITANRA